MPTYSVACKWREMRFWKSQQAFNYSGRNTSVKKYIRCQVPHFNASTLETQTNKIFKYINYE